MRREVHREVARIAPKVEHVVRTQPVGRVGLQPRLVQEGPVQRPRVRDRPVAVDEAEDGVAARDGRVGEAQRRAPRVPAHREGRRRGGHALRGVLPVGDGYGRHGVLGSSIIRRRSFY